MGKENQNPLILNRREFIGLAGSAATGLVFSACTPSWLRQKETIETEELKPEEITKIEELEPGVVWKQEYLEFPYLLGQHYQSFFPQKDRVFLTDPENHALALRLRDGELLWQHREEGMIYGTDTEAVYAIQPAKQSDEPLTFYALNPENGETKWQSSFQQDQAIRPSSLQIGPKTVHLLLEPNLITLDKNNGELFWQSEEICPVEKGITEETLLVSKDHLSGLNLLTGEEKWQLPKEIPIAPWVSGESFFYLTPTARGVVLTAVDIDSGNILWQSERSGMNFVSHISDRVVYALYSERYWGTSVSAIDRQTGKEFWSQDLGDPLSVSINPLEQLSVLSGGGHTRAVETLTGRELWRNDQRDLYHLIGLNKETLVGLSLGGTFPHNSEDDPFFLFGLNPKNGRQKWHLTLEKLTEEPLIFGNEIAYGTGSIYGGEQKLIFLDSETGQQTFSIPFSQRISELVPQGDRLLVHLGQYCQKPPRSIPKEPPYELQPCPRTLCAVQR